MKVIELRNTPIIIEWLQTANVKPNSEKSYLHGMQDFTEYTGKNPETLLEEAEMTGEKKFLTKYQDLCFLLWKKGHFLKYAHIFPTIQ